MDRRLALVATVPRHPAVAMAMGHQLAPLLGPATVHLPVTARLPAVTRTGRHQAATHLATDMAAHRALGTAMVRREGQGRATTGEAGVAAAATGGRIDRGTEIATEIAIAADTATRTRRKMAGERTVVKIRTVVKRRTAGGSEAEKGIGRGEEEAKRQPRLVPVARARPKAVAKAVARAVARAVSDQRRVKKRTLICNITTVAQVLAKCARTPTTDPHSRNTYTVLPVQARLKVTTYIAAPVFVCNLLVLLFISIIIHSSALGLRGPATTLGRTLR